MGFSFINLFFIFSIWKKFSAKNSKNSKELKKLVEFTGIPVFTTMQGKSAFDERHPLSLGAGCGTTTLAAHNWLKNSDVVLVLGSSLTRTPYGQVLSSEKTLLHNTIDPEDLNKDVSAMVGLVGDTKLTLLALMEEFKTEGFKKDNDRTYNSDDWFQWSEGRVTLGKKKVKNTSSRDIYSYGFSIGADKIKKEYRK